MARRDHDTERAIGARVRFARIQKHLSQGALGEHLGISFQQVQKYETGKDRIAASQLLKIAKVLDEPISFFVEDVGDPGDAGPALADIVDRRGQGRASNTQNARIVRALARVPNGPVKSHILRLIQALGTPDEQPSDGADEAAVPQPQAA